MKCEYTFQLSNIVLLASNGNITYCEKVCHYPYMINLLLLFLRQIFEEQYEEQEIEAKIQSITSGFISLYSYN